MISEKKYRWNINYAIGLTELSISHDSYFREICQALLDEIEHKINNYTNNNMYRILDIIFVG